MLGLTYVVDSVLVFSVVVKSGELYRLGFLYYLGISEVKRDPQDAPLFVLFVFMRVLLFLNFHGMVYAAAVLCPSDFSTYIFTAALVVV